MRKWLARLSYSLLIVGVLLLIQVYLGMSGRWVGASGPMITLAAVCAIVCLVAGAWGIRIRHAAIVDDVENGEDKIPR